MLDITMIDLLNRQSAALVHLATTCDDEGLAVCLEGVVRELYEALDALESDGIEFSKDDRSNLQTFQATVCKQGVHTEKGWLNHPGLFAHVGEAMTICRIGLEFYAVGSSGRAYHLK